MDEGRNKLEHSETKERELERIEEGQNKRNMRESG